MFPNLGLEPTPQEHIQHIVEIFREVKRVLRDDGVVFLNYGDCYSSGVRGGGREYTKAQDCPNCDCALSDRDGEHEEVLPIDHIAHTDDLPSPSPSLEPCDQSQESMESALSHVSNSDSLIQADHTLTATQDLSPNSSPTRSLPFVPRESNEQPSSPESHRNDASRPREVADQHSSLTSSGDVRESLYTADCKTDKACSVCQCACHNSDMDDSSAYHNYTIPPAGNLMMIPHRVAIALQDDEWVVRNDLIWFKRNPMPESCAGWRFQAKGCDCHGVKTNWSDTGDSSRNNAPFIHSVTQVQEMLSKTNPGCPKCHGTGKVGDPVLKKGSWRHTRAHEYIFMLTKKMQYWSNQEAVREVTGKEIDSIEYEKLKSEKTWQSGRLEKGNTNPGYTAGRSHPGGRNPRSVLDVPTAPYSGAHYATFPPNLIAPLIRASCPRRACPECGQGWSPVVEPSERYAKLLGQSIHDHSRDDERGQQHDKEQMKAIDSVRSSGLRHAEYRTLGYRPTCECGHDEYVAGICLDPFIGSGTTGAVAKELQRRWVGLDISMEYLDEQAKIRALNWTPKNALDGLPLFDRGQKGADHEI